MWKWAKPDLSDLGNDLLSDSIKSFSSQFVITIMGKPHAKTEEKVTEQILNNWTISVNIGEKWQI